MDIGRVGVIMTLESLRPFPSNMKFSKSFLALPSSALAIAALAPSLQAASLTWDNSGPSNVWSTSANNWIGGLPWSDGSIATFGGTGETVEIDGTVIATGTSNSPYALTFSVGGYNITDTNGNGLLRLQGTGGGAGTSKAIISHTGANTISANILLSGTVNNNARSINGASGASLTISGNISESDSVKSLSMSGASSTVTLSGSNSFSGGVNFGNSSITLNVNGAHSLGTGTMTIGSSVTPTTIGNTSGGAITLATNNALNLTTTTVGTTANSNMIYFSANDLNFGTGAVTFGGANARSITVSGAGKLTLGGNISEAIAGTVLIKNGVGTLELGGIGAYTGNTNVNAGTLLLTSTSESRFVIANANATNRFLGTGTVSFDGDFRLDITGLTDSTGTWNLVNVATLSESFGSNFGLAFVGGPSFTNNGDGTYTSGGWTFDTASGNLSLVPEPSTVLLAGAGLMLTLFRARSRRS
jgi:autotransporter-associated beta strand protein